MSDGVSDCEAFLSSEGCYSIHNQQGDPFYFPPSPEYAYSAAIEAAEKTDEIEEVAGCTHCMEVSTTAASEVN